MSGKAARKLRYCALPPSSATAAQEFNCSGVHGASEWTDGTNMVGAFGCTDGEPAFWSSSAPFPSKAFACHLHLPRSMC